MLVLSLECGVKLPVLPIWEILKGGNTATEVVVDQRLPVFQSSYARDELVEHFLLTRPNSNWCCSAGVTPTGAAWPCYSKRFRIWAMFPPASERFLVMSAILSPDNWGCYGSKSDPMHYPWQSNSHDSHTIKKRGCSRGHRSKIVGKPRDPVPCGPAVRLGRQAGRKSRLTTAPAVHLLTNYASQ